MPSLTGQTRATMIQTTAALTNVFVWAMHNFAAHQPNVQCHKTNKLQIYKSKWQNEPTKWYCVCRVRCACQKRPRPTIPLYSQFQNYNAKHQEFENHYGALAMLCCEQTIKFLWATNHQEVHRIWIALLFTFIYTFPTAHLLALAHILSAIAHAQMTYQIKNISIALTVFE